MNKTLIKLIYINFNLFKKIQILAVKLIEYFQIEKESINKDLKILFYRIT